jgi:Fe2+ transport system protein B
MSIYTRVITFVLLTAAILSFVPVYAQSQREKDAALAELQAQHTRDVATIARLIAENKAAATSVSNNKNSAAAITKLGDENKKRADVAAQQADSHAQKAQEAVNAAQDTATETKNKVDAIKPYDYTPVWLVAISGFVSITVAFITSQKLDGVVKTVDIIHEHTDGTLSEMTNAFNVQLERVAGLEKQVTILSAKSAQGKDC